MAVGTRRTGNNPEDNPAPDAAQELAGGGENPGANAMANQGAGVVANPAGYPLPPAPPPRFAFALTPGQAFIGPIDFYGKEGQKYYENATRSLEKEQFNCVPDELYQFIAMLKMRSAEFGWDHDQTGVLMIPNDYGSRTGPMTNILEEYGILNLEQLRDFEKTYMASATRLAQDDRLLFQCIYNSISKEGKKKILIWKDDYEIKIGGKLYQSGILLLKVVIRESHLDTNATISMVRHKLSNLDTYMSTIGNDVTKFNGYVKMLVDGLSARGEITNDLLVNLFKGYGACSDKSFVDYIRRKQERYDEGDDIKPEQLMQFADTKFKQLKDKELWEAPSLEEEKLLALETKLQDLKKRLANSRDKPSKTGQGKNKKKSEEIKQKDAKKQRLERPKWMFEKPAEAELRKPRKWNGKDWHFCGAETGGKCTPGQYRVHKPGDCKGMGKPKDGNKKVTIKAALAEVESDGYETGS